MDNTMKFMRILAMILAMMLMGTFCIAETAETTEEEYPLHTAILLSAMEMTYDEWLETPETRALFAVLFELELRMYEEEYRLYELMDTYGVPTIFIGEPSGDLAGQALSIYFFYQDTEGTMGTGVLVSASIILEGGMFGGFVMDNNVDPYTMMPVFTAEGGVISNYFEVGFQEYYDAVMMLDSIMNGEE